MANFRAFPEIEIPDGFVSWTDVSWGNDACASLMRGAGTAEHPRACYVLWVAETDPSKREFRQMPLYSLTWNPDDEAVGEDTRTVYEGHDYAALIAAARKEGALVDPRPGTLVAPKNADEARLWLRSCAEYLGLGFHPDTRGQDYVDNGTGKRTFTRAEAKAFERAREMTFGLLDDPYADGLREWERLGLIASDAGAR